MHLSVNPNWYVLYTYPNFEKRIRKTLVEKDISVYLPLQKTVRQWSDRKKEIEVPLFPNYIFVNISEKERISVLSTPGVVKFLSTSGKPCVVSDEEISSIQIILEHNDKQLDLIVENGLAPGDRVRVTDGPLNGLEGILSEKKGKKRFIIMLENIGRYLSIQIGIEKLHRIA